MAQTALTNLANNDAVVFQDAGAAAEMTTPFADSNRERRLADTLPGAWQDDRQVLEAVESVRDLNYGEAKDGVMVYATSRKTMVSWSLGGGIDDASVSRMELSPGQSSVGVAYRTGQTSVALGYVSREYSQRIGAETVSQSESFAGVTLKLQLGEK
jgi:hypothetical protein